MFDKNKTYVFRLKKYRQAKDISIFEPIEGLNLCDGAIVELKAVDENHVLGYVSLYRHCNVIVEPEWCEEVK